jgi:hypothetical protein
MVLYESTWPAGSADAVSAVLLHDTLMNEYVLDSATKSGTDWVVTFPTKRYYVSNGTGNANRLFQRNFNSSAGSCDDLQIGTFDRDERTTTPPIDFGGQIMDVYSLCWAGNVAAFNDSSVLGSTNGALDTFGGTPGDHPLGYPFQNGWLTLGFPTLISGARVGVHQSINNGATSISGSGLATSTGNTVTYVDLPAIGFAVVSFTNGTLVVGTPPVNVLSNYGGNFVHKKQHDDSVAPMCGLLRALHSPSAVALALGLKFPPEIAPRYNIAPTQQVPAVRLRDGERELSQVRWGLVPFWAKDPGGAPTAART